MKINYVSKKGTDCYLGNNMSFLKVLSCIFHSRRRQTASSCYYTATQDIPDTAAVVVVYTFTLQLLMLCCCRGVVGAQSIARCKLCRLRSPRRLMLVRTTLLGDAGGYLYVVFNVLTDVGNKMMLSTFVWYEEVREASCFFVFGILVLFPVHCPLQNV